MTLRLISSLIFCSVFVAVQARASDRWIEKSRAMNLHQETQWLNLVHYRPTVWGGVKSQADDFGFFNAGKEGLSDPKKELEGTIRAFFKASPHDDTHPRCLFPARFRWLTNKLGWNLKEFPEVKCTKFKEYFDRHQGKSVTLVFSSYYLNSPSSSFGHTLLRVNKTAHSVPGQRFELLDNGLNYAAVMTSSNPIIYAVSAIGGLFPGSFTSMPYYYKVREYNDFEARDLWEYDLNLTQDEVDMLVAHFWELGNTRFDYFYLTENCSYHMFSALDAAAPQHQLQDRLPYWVIPADTIKIAYDTPGLIREIHFRPAVRTQFRYRTASLTSHEQELLLQITHQREIPEKLTSLPHDRRSAVLDAAIDYVDWHYASEIVLEKGGPVDFKQRLLVARSQVPFTSEELKLAPPLREAPHLQHDSARAWISSGSSSRSGSFTRVAHRFALHDLLDPLRGFPEYGQIEFLNFAIRRNHRERSWWLEDMSLFSLVSISELDEFNRAPSWRVKLGGRTIRDEVCDNCFAFDLQGGPGLALRLMNHPQTSVVSYLDLDLSSSPKFRGPHLRLRSGPSLLLRTSFIPDFQLLTSFGQKWPVFSNIGATGEASLHLRWAITRQFAVDAKSSFMSRPDSWEHYAGLMYYY